MTRLVYPVVLNEHSPLQTPYFDNGLGWYAVDYFTHVIRGVPVVRVNGRWENPPIPGPGDVRVRPLGAISSHVPVSLSPRDLSYITECHRGYWAGTRHYDTRSVGVVGASGGHGDGAPSGQGDATGGRGYGGGASGAGDTSGSRLPDSGSAARPACFGGDSTTIGPGSGGEARRANAGTEEVKDEVSSARAPPFCRMNSGGEP